MFLSKENSSSSSPLSTPPPKLAESPNARSKSISTADGADTFGVLNCHAARNIAYQVGISEDKGARRTMEDAHSFVVDFPSVRGQGFFAVFDGHAGKHAAEWCGSHFHEIFLECLRSTPDLPIPDTLNQVFHKVDAKLSQMCEESEGKIHSGCTAVTAFLRIEDLEGKQSFLPRRQSSPETSASPEGSDDNVSDSSTGASSLSPTSTLTSKKSKRRSRFKQALQSISKRAGGSRPSSPPSSTPASSILTEKAVPVTVPPPGTRRVLYTANAGDARAVLCRSGRAIRLTYDHKGSDKQEAKRIVDAGGFVMSGRVNGVLAVTRSLGDSSMKEFVVGSPYTTETELCEEDEFLILACDGLWDVATDQSAVDLIQGIRDAQLASEKLLKYALSQHTSDNVTVLVVRFKNGTTGVSSSVSS